MARKRRPIALALVIATAVALAAPTVATARTININAQTKLHLVKNGKNGNQLRERGTATGTLPGPVVALFTVSLTSITGTVTLLPEKGSITLTISGRPTGSRRGKTTASGTMTIVAGTGRYSGARGSASFNGTLDRSTWATTVHATGSLTY
ncbi:autotransporter [Conexibacter sp. CPCC 206217]|uniref:autotransporter n=1 Tax=Conexibacter sp. CPCC 206217 TaxID=3064574 RepID=UPI0027204E4C|nr:autotransporter [Conexibacter sp. CPCC 206217]MDO8209660.1 autotransporter [Conexibacter sp. CPCC 206217]